ncbi:MAG: penicillin-binding transpeptidase domain-containing protein [bacterium]|nr:penicillin-binding transpeptidase domain-containing protein [bacterium]
MDGFYDYFDPHYRLTTIKILVVGFILVLLGRLTTITVFSGNYYNDLSSGNRTREEIIPANRGVIYDRNNDPLVINYPAYLFKDKVLTKEEALLEQGSVAVVARRYFLGSAAAHLLGYVNIADRLGVSGVEYQYNSSLRGTDGRELVETDATGKKIKTLGTVNPVDGQNIILSIDAALQKVAYEQIKDVKGAVVVSSPATGEILALISSPSFDPNLFTFPKTTGIDAILTDENQPFFDRAISATYPPGSTFKIISATAALQSGIVTADTLFEDTGVLIIGPYKFYNWLFTKRGAVDGWLNIVTAIQKSNDLFFYKLGGEVGVDNLVEMAKIFGLGEKLGIDLPGEAKGNIRNNREWYLGDTYHMVIGQADLLVTPLQVNFWTNVIANGGNLCRPHLTGLPSCKSLNFKPETLNLIKTGMTQACADGGTAWPLFGLNMACKTGTAEYGDPKNQTHAWLTGFYPIDKPEISVTVLVESGGEGSDVAAPMVKKIVEAWKNK